MQLLRDVFLSFGQKQIKITFLKIPSMVLCCLLSLSFLATWAAAIVHICNKIHDFSHDSDLNCSSRVIKSHQESPRVINPFWGSMMQNCITLKNRQGHYSFHNILRILRHTFLTILCCPRRQKGLRATKINNWLRLTIKLDQQLSKIYNWLRLTLNLHQQLTEINNQLRPTINWDQQLT